MIWKSNPVNKIRDEGNWMEPVSLLFIDIAIILFSVLCIIYVYIECI